ncbi:Uncharacterized protein SSS_06929 [Sarcoptes scabiei]|uniref:DUF4602 domain containing protein n=1 Tax=Sarcoptes scabiei TaxID=52283 RepID=A0A132A4F5_SARSC|nr:Uncharacterized protein SSS_06929 [Sarcoptes scabiei]KPM05862.1 DUF4602 domain containing protein [Sarcoptes scabiei]
MRSFRKKNYNKLKKEGRDPSEFDLETARNEVFRFGIKGLSAQDKKTARRDLAIRLGAIPKKPRGKNIKQHIEEVRERKKQEKLEEDSRREMGIKTKTKSSFKTKAKKKGLNEVRGMDYQLGTYRNGVQFLSKDDLKRIKSGK